MSRTPSVSEMQTCVGLVERREPAGDSPRPNSVSDFPFDADGVLRLSTAAALGFDEGRVLRAAAAGELVRIGPGIYVPPADRTPEELHRLLAHTAAIPHDTVISHASAAAIHGLPMLSPDLSRLHVTSVASGRGYRRTRRHVHSGPLGADDVTHRGDVAVTTLERTAFDVARSSPLGYAGALAVFDAALRRKACYEQMAHYCDRPQRGVGHARAALVQANPLAENPGESWGRAQLIQAALPIPSLQRRIYDSAGHFIARTDYDWCDDSGTVRVVGEFDGLAKYLKYLRPGETPEDAIRREKEREGRLQDLGLVVVRWTWRDLVEARVVPRLRAQLAAVGLVARQRPA